MMTILIQFKHSIYVLSLMVQQLAEDETKRFPLGSALMSDFYMDDVITGSDNLTELVAAQQELIYILSSAGMKIRKFAANNPLLLDHVPVEDREMNWSFHDSELECPIKTLGLRWSPIEDCISYRLPKQSIPSVFQ